jgi:PAS domain S-box-containing protein
VEQDTLNHVAPVVQDRAVPELVDFFENATVGLHIVSGDGIILRANRTELEVLGYSPAEYIGRHIAEFHADPEVIDDILQRLGRGETLHEYKARMLAKDGSIRHVVINSSALFEGERFVHTRCFTRDVTSLVEAETEAERLTRRLQLITDSMPALISYVDGEERYQFVNKGYQDWFGYPHEDLIGQHLRDVLGEEAYSKVQPYARAALSGKRTAFETQVPYQAGGSATFTRNTCRTFAPTAPWPATTLSSPTSVKGCRPRSAFQRS